MLDSYVGVWKREILFFIVLHLFPQPKNIILNSSEGP